MCVCYVCVCVCVCVCARARALQRERDFFSKVSLFSMCRFCDVMLYKFKQTSKGKNPPCNWKIDIIIVDKSQKLFVFCSFLVLFFIPFFFFIEYLFHDKALVLQA